MPDSIHDNHIYGCQIAAADGRGATITLHTVFEHGDQPRPTYTDIIFHGVAAHYLLGEVVTTILFDIEEVSIGAIVDGYRDLFERTRPYGWPIDGAAPDELPAYGQRHGLSAYQISTSYGLVEGWVWAQRMEIRERTRRWDLAA